MTIGPTTKKKTISGLMMICDICEGSGRKSVDANGDVTKVNIYYNYDCPTCEGISIRDISMNELPGVLLKLGYIPIPKKQKAVVADGTCECFGSEVLLGTESMDTPCPTYMSQCQICNDSGRVFDTTNGRFDLDGSPCPVCQPDKETQ